MGAYKVTPMMGKISIITATLNSEKTLPSLIESLESQTDGEFEWIVVDGGSTDRTLKLLHDSKISDLIVDSRSDGGIYDALNRALSISKNDYYLVLGSDDRLESKAVKLFRETLAEQLMQPDFITANIQTDKGIVKDKFKMPWLYSQYAYLTSHAVGTLIRKSLHEQHGKYSLKLPIAADQLFLKRACDSGAKIVRANFIAGHFSTKGVSGLDKIGSLTESFRAQLQTGENKWVQLCLFVLRSIKLFLHN